MINFLSGRALTFARFAALMILLCGLPLLSGCSSLNFIKREVTVPPLLAPLVEANTARLIAEVNRVASVKSLRGKVDIQFLDTSFAKCGVAEKYRTADGTVIVERPGRVNLRIQVPFAGTDVAQMASDGERFQVAVLQGDAKYRRFVRGTNSQVKPKLETGVAEADCEGGDEKKRATTERRAVGALSGLRPQHFTDALLIRPVAGENSNYIYARSEAFAEESDDRPRAKRGARVVRGYYLLDELAPEGSGREARLLRRFWFDRFGALRLARVQTFDDGGSLTTDVVYKEPKSFGDGGRHTLPSRVELTRPQDRYSIQISYQTPAEVKTDEEYKSEIFVLQNRWQLPETDLDSRTQQSINDVLKN